MIEFRTNEANFFKNGSLAIEKSWLQNIKKVLEANKDLVSTEAKSFSEDNDPNLIIVPVDPSGKTNESIGIINITGVLLYSGPDWIEMFGYMSYQAIGRRLDALIADARVKTIILRVQSPGGSTFGCSELANKIFEARNKKKIVAYADPYAFSAGYWIASAASSLYTTISGMVGSIGVYTIHVDESKWLEDMGLKVTFIKAGEKKTDGNSSEPLSESAKKDIQSQVDKTYELFIEDVAKNRGVSPEYVKENYGKGGTFLADEALQIGMIDAIASFNMVLNSELTAISDTITLTLEANKRQIQREKDLIDLED